jgi:maltokinase
MTEAQIEVPEEALREYVAGQRWFGAKAREVSHFTLLEAVEVIAGRLVIALVEVRFQPGTHEIYQVPLGLRPEGRGPAEGVVSSGEGRVLYDALVDPELTLALYGLMDAGRQPAQARLMGAEQSNTSVVFDEQAVMKLYRRLEPGENPELELLRFLTERGFDHVPALLGWFHLEAHTLGATLGIVQEFLPGARDGWELALEEIGTDPDGFLARLQDLGDVTGRMHTVLASDLTDPSFAPEEPSIESLSLLTADIDEQIERIFQDLPDAEALGPIAGRGEEVRERLRALAALNSAGRSIRHHGDFHLGQVLSVADRGWVVLDFEGEPARSLAERRRKRSPLRDVAGMLRSFAYAASAAAQRGTPPPPGWEAQARETFLRGYAQSVDPALLPPGQSATDQLLGIYELEKAVYELRYELNNRPDWVSIPVDAIVRLLEVTP